MFIDIDIFRVFAGSTEESSVGVLYHKVLGFSLLLESDKQKVLQEPEGST